MFLVPDSRDRLLARLASLQREFDAGPSKERMVRIYLDHAGTYRLLLGMGMTEVEIETALAASREAPPAAPRQGRRSFLDLFLFGLFRRKR
jgi:hypothetical protein